VVRNVRIEAEVLKVLGDDGRLEVAIAQTLARSFMVVELLDELGEAEVYEGFARDLRIVLGK